MIAVARVDEEKSRAANLQPVKEALEFFVESLPKQAKVMRDKCKTGDWVGAERVARAFDRHAMKAREALAHLNKMQSADTTRNPRLTFSVG
jgi:hypothetical protein